MHGLWPTGVASNVCSHIAECVKVTYNQSLIDSSLLDWMKKKYAGLYNSSGIYLLISFCDVIMNLIKYI